MSIPDITVINKKIIYSDTILPPKNIGNNLKITSIENINFSSLDICLKTIIKANPTVTFNSIQYSKKDKKIYFYTDKEITITEYEKNKLSQIKILEEIKKILDSNKIKNNDCISLFDVATLIYQMEHKYTSIINNYEKNFNNIIANEFGKSTSIVINGFDYNKNELSIKFNYVDNVPKEIIFTKKNNELYISKSETYWDKEIFDILGTKLSQLYEELIKFSKYKKEKKYEIISVNCEFIIDISSYGIDIYNNIPTNKFMKDFELTFPSYSDEYIYECNSSNLINAFKGCETEIFKKIFIKINDCPQWSQEKLYKIRKKQLEEEQRIEKTEKEFQIKKQKRKKVLALTKKIFPFIKKEHLN